MNTSKVVLIVILQFKVLKLEGHLEDLTGGILYLIRDRNGEPLNSFPTYKLLKTYIVLAFLKIHLVTKTEILIISTGPVCNWHNNEGECPEI